MTRPVVFLSGPITENIDYKRDFRRAERKMRKLGYIVLNPARAPLGMRREQYIYIDNAMLDVADVVCMLPGWENSDGAQAEYKRAEKQGKAIREL